MKLALAIAVLICVSAAASAQRRYVSDHQPKERVIGLLDLPDVTGNSDDACMSKQAAVQLYERPSAAANVAGAVYMRNHPEFGCALFFRRARAAVDAQLPNEESSYEVAAAVVYERRGQWFRIAVPDGSAWIDRPGADEFLPYPRLLRERLSYLRRDWDVNCDGRPASAVGSSRCRSSGGSRYRVRSGLK